MSTSQRASILPVTFRTPALEPGPARIASSNRQTLFARQRAGTESAICMSAGIEKASWEDFGGQLKGNISNQNLTGTGRLELFISHSQF